MRCALCGGEIDDKTKQCTKCGECWGGGNRGIAREVSQYSSVPTPAPPAPSALEKCASSVKKALSSIDNAMVRSVGKATSLMKIKTTAQQNRLIVYSLIFFIISAILVVSVASCAACHKNEICGTWVPTDSSGSVSIELSADGEVKLLVLSGDTEKVYRQGSYTVNKDLLEINYADGESITLTFTIDGDTAVFTLLSTGESQTYTRK